MTVLQYWHSAKALNSILFSVFSLRSAVKIRTFISSIHHIAISYPVPSQPSRFALIPNKRRPTQWTGCIPVDAPSAECRPVPDDTSLLITIPRSAVSWISHIQSLPFPPVYMLPQSNVMLILLVTSAVFTVCHSAQCLITLATCLREI